MIRSPSPRLTLAAAGLAALAIVLVGLWFRTVHLLAEPLWLDEAYSAYAAAKGFDFLWHVVPRYETHPPFYYSLVRLWTLLFGDSLAGHRSLGIVCGAATLAVSVAIAREAARRWPAAFGSGLALALALLLLAALSPSLVEMTREVRPYPVMILVYSGILWALLRLGRVAEADGRIARGAFALYLAGLALMLWLHNLGPLYGAAIGLAFLAMVARRGLPPRDWMLFVAGHLLVALVWLPALLILADQAPMWVKSTWLKFSFDAMLWRLALLWAAPGTIAMAAAAVLGLGALFVVARLREGWRLALALALLAGLPVALSILLSVLVTPVFIVRTMTPVAMPALLLLAMAAVGLKGLWRWAMLAALAVLAVQMAVLDRNERAGGPMQNWYGTVDWLAARYRPGDQVWAYPNEGALPFDYAVRDRRVAVTTRPIPTPIPTLDGGPGAWNPTGSRGVFSLPPARLAAIARSGGAVPTIWLLRLGANAYDKGDVLLHALERDRVRVGRWKSGPIEIIGLRRRGG
ncbi:glycosyltransferase family 39 protein [Sphingomonas profundi]|uniref:glycosyltransferase family 39 protein n=1 Tax=Alterirhizorhabdus profundi TaxID=2681549 RepID=UPI001E42D96E|nr:glycosyltransferase family 39 protein [Sphingomonas profundi]